MKPDDLLKIAELAKDTELGDLLADFAAGRSNDAAVSAAYHQGISAAYAEITALLEGRVQFNATPTTGSLVAADPVGNGDAGDGTNA